jgi:hypothetical protein
MVADVFVQSETLKEFHTQEPDFAPNSRLMAEEFVYTTDIRMRDGTRLLYFTPEALENLCVICQLRANRLYRDSLFEFRIPRLINLPHSTAGNKAVYGEAAGNDHGRLEETE